MRNSAVRRDIARSWWTGSGPAQRRRGLVQTQSTGAHEGEHGIEVSAVEVGAAALLALVNDDARVEPEITSTRPLGAQGAAAIDDPLRHLERATGDVARRACIVGLARARRVDHTREGRAVEPGSPAGPAFWGAQVPPAIGIHVRHIDALKLHRGAAGGAGEPCILPWARIHLG